MSDYDKLTALFKSATTGLCARSRVKGDAGSRVRNGANAAFDRDMAEDPDYLLEHIKEKTGLSGQVLLFNVDKGDGDDQADGHNIIVGHLSSNPDETWAIQIDATVPHIEDFDVTAEVIALESRDQIDTLIGSLGNKALMSVADQINELMEGEAASPDATGKVFDLLMKMNASWMKVWEARFLDRSLENNTGPASSGTRKPPRV